MRFWPLMLALAIAAAGCAPKTNEAETRHPNAPATGKTPSGSEPSSLEKTLYGRWVGEKPEPPQAKNDKKPPAEKGLSNSMAALVGGFSIDLNEDYSFRMDLAGTRLDGTWELKGDLVRLTVENVMGKPESHYASPANELDKELAKFFDTPPSPKVRESGTELVSDHEAAKGIVFTKGT